METGFPSDDVNDAETAVPPEQEVPVFIYRFELVMVVPLSVGFELKVMTMLVFSSTPVAPLVGDQLVTDGAAAKLIVARQSVPNRIINVIILFMAAPLETPPR